MGLGAKLLDGAAGFAGVAISAGQGLKNEIRTMARSHLDEIIADLQLVRREELEIAEEIAVRARTELEEMERRVARLEEHLQMRRESAFKDAIPAEGAGKTETPAAPHQAHKIHPNSGRR